MDNIKSNFTIKLNYIYIIKRAFSNYLSNFRRTSIKIAPLTNQRSYTFNTHPTLKGPYTLHTPSNNPNHTMSYTFHTTNQTNVPHIPHNPNYTRILHLPYNQPSNVLHLSHTFHTTSAICPLRTWSEPVPNTSEMYMGIQLMNM